MKTEMISDNKAGKIWTKDFITILISNLFMSMGQFMMNTLVPKYAYQLGATASIVGLVTSAFAVTALALRPVAGPSMDYFKKNRLLSFALGLLTVTFIVYGFSKSIPMLVVARLMHGVAMSLSAPLSLAIVCNILPSDKMASGVGIFALGNALATAIGPSVGLKIADLFSYNATFFFCAALMFTSFLLSFLLKSDNPDRSQGFRISLDKIIAPEALLPAFVIFFLSFAYASVNSFMAIYGGLNGVKEIGLFFTVSAIFMIFIRPVSGRIADKYGHDKSIIPGLIILIAAFILISLSHTLPMFLIAGAVTALGFGTSQPLVQTMIMQIVPKARRGAAGNTNYIGTDFAYLIGPAISGYIITAVQTSTGNEVLGFSIMYRIMVLPVIVALAVFWFNRKKLIGRIETQKHSPEEICPAK